MDFWTSAAVKLMASMSLKPTHTQKEGAQLHNRDGTASTWTLVDISSPRYSMHDTIYITTHPTNKEVRQTNDRLRAAVTFGDGGGLLGLFVGGVAFPLSPSAFPFASAAPTDGEAACLPALADDGPVT